MRIMYQIVTFFFSSEIHFLKEWLTSFDGEPVGNLEGSELKLLPLGLDVGCNNMKRRECIM